MTKFFALVFISLLSLTSFAGVGSWQMVDEEHYTAPDNESFMALQGEFPQYFGNVDGTSVASGALDIYIFEFRGPTVCQAGDPRLTSELVTTQVCFNNGSCMSSMPAMLPPVDPCL